MEEVGVMSSKRYLAVYDYGSGGVWMYVRAASKDQIRARFPGLSVVNEEPSWMTLGVKKKLQDSMSFDADKPTGLLRSLRASPEGSSDTGGATLSNREREVLKLLAEGATVTDVARSLKIRESTTRNHIRHILEKLRVETGVHDRQPVASGSR